MLNGVYAYKEHTREISFSTSSGDKIKLDLTSKKEGEFSSDGESIYGSFSQELGFDISINGNGLDEQDKFEIKEMMEKIEPLIVEFYEKNKNQENVSHNEYLKNISDLIPKSENEKIKTQVDTEIVKKFDDIFNKKELNESLFLNIKNLLEDILEKRDNLKDIVYA